MIDTWRPAQYNKFLAEREQPFYDLVSMIDPRPSARVVDLGCGTGRLTRQLHARVGAVSTLGVDRSAQMLAPALAEPPAPGVAFEVATIESVLDGGARFDIVFSNAVFQWIDDHPALLARVARILAPGGQLAFQVPAMHDEPSHTVADELSLIEPFRSALGDWERSHSVLSPDDYARLLFRLGFRPPSVRLIVYPHVLSARDDVVEWMKGTLLAEYEKRLPPELYQRFVEMYRERLLPQYEDASPFLYPFKRILCHGQLAS